MGRVVAPSHPAWDKLVRIHWNTIRPWAGWWPHPTQPGIDSLGSTGIVTVLGPGGAPTPPGLDMGSDTQSPLQTPARSRQDPIPHTTNRAYRPPPHSLRGQGICTASGQAWAIDSTPGGMSADGARVTLQSLRVRVPGAEVGPARALQGTFWATPPWGGT